MATTFSTVTAPATFAPFRTHTGEIITGDRLKAAFTKVADDWAKGADAIRKEDAYASHVTQAQKDDAYERRMEQSEVVRNGTISSFTIWQRLNTELTGECVALLPK